MFYAHGRVRTQNRQGPNIHYMAQSMWTPAHPTSHPKINGINMELIPPLLRKPPLFWEGFPLDVGTLLRGFASISWPYGMPRNWNRPRQNVKREVEECQSQSSSMSEAFPSSAAPPAKRLQSSVERLIHGKTKCVWCCKPESAKHPKSKLSLISYGHAWAAFKSHAVALKDQKMQDRINCVIDYAAGDPYAIEIRYHNKCWLKYVRSYEKMSEDDKLPRMHNANLHEAQTIFFDHIRTVIFDEHELRSLQILLKDYSSIIYRYGFPTSAFINYIYYSSVYFTARDPYGVRSGMGACARAACHCVHFKELAELKCSNMYSQVLGVLPSQNQFFLASSDQLPWCIQPQPRQHKGLELHAPGTGGRG